MSFRLLFIECSNILIKNNLIKRPYFNLFQIGGKGSKVPTWWSEKMAVDSFASAFLFLVAATCPGNLSNRIKK